MPNFSTALINAHLGRHGTDAVVDGMRGRMANGRIELRSGAIPATADSAVSGTLLGIVTKNGGAFVPGQATNGLNLASPVLNYILKTTDTWKFTALASGTVGYARFIGNEADDGSASTSVARIDMTVGVGSGDMPMDTLDVVEDSEYTVSSFALTWAEAPMFSTGLINALLGKYGTDANCDGLRGVMQDCFINFYTGIAPASANAAATGTLLGTASKNAGAFAYGQPTNGLNFAAPVGKIITKNTDTWAFVGLTDGVAGYFRAIHNDGDDGSLSTTAPRIQGTVGVQNGNILLNSILVRADATNTISGFTIRSN